MYRAYVVYSIEQRTDSPLARRPTSQTSQQEAAVVSNSLLRRPELDYNIGIHETTTEQRNTHNNIFPSPFPFLWWSVCCGVGYYHHLQFSLQRPCPWYSRQSETATIMTITLMLCLDNQTWSILDHGAVWQTSAVFLVHSIYHFVQDLPVYLRLCAESEKKVKVVLLMDTSKTTK